MRKFTELFTIPLGFLFYYLFGYIAEIKGWHVYGTGVFQKLFLGFVLFLIVIGLARIIFYLTFPTLYKYIDQDFKENDKWEWLQPRERTWAGLILLCVYVLVFATLVANL
jgi:uncharacterized BrkB/YihY/UPF0761 family membrane protein